MSRCVALRHVPFESLGLLAPVLNAAGFQIEYVEVPESDCFAELAREAELVVVLGGPISVYEEHLYPFLSAELKLLTQRLTERRPTLGVCLGAQLMAQALGGRVYPGAGKEIGWSRLTLTEAGYQSPLGELEGLEVLHWHGDTFDLPPSAERLASTPTTPNQAFRVDRHALALQFHLEVQATQLESWYVGHAAELSSWGQRSVPELRADAKRYAPALAPAAERAFRRMLAEMFA